MREEFFNAKFLIAFMAMAVFCWAYGENVEDETMKGAIIGGFNLALGFYLGSNSQAAQATSNTGKAFDAITASANANGGQPTDAIREGDTVTMNKEPEA